VIQLTKALLEIIISGDFFYYLIEALSLLLNLLHIVQAEVALA
jgi:hypothetical protein